MRKNDATKFLLAVVIWLTMPISVSAAVEISEIMYDLPGGDDGREWVEVWNNGAEAINFAEWKFFEANTNHGIVFSRGNETIAPGGFAIIVDNPDKFLIDYPNFSGNLFDSSFSLSNTGEHLALKNGDAIIDEVSYSSDWGAGGDGNSLQKISDQWKVGTPTPGVANVASSNSSSNNPPTGGQNSSSSQSSSQTTSTEKPPEMSVEIIANKTAVVGADALFIGKALDTNGKPLDNIRSIWNFGDGEIKEGQNVLHRFRFPGEYIVTLDIAYGKWGTMARTIITAIKSPLVISRVKEGTEGFIELTNEGGAELDLFGWYLKSGNTSFLIPKNTLLAGNKKIIFPNEVTGLTTDDVLLLYPNGVVAVNYEKPTPAPLVEKVFEAKAMKTITPPSGPVSFPESDSGKLDTSTTSTITAAVYEATPESNGIGVWLLALGGLIVVSLGAFLFSKQKAIPADEYKIIE